MDKHRRADRGPAGTLAPARRFLTSRRLPLYLAIVAIVLTLPSLWGGWVADDHHHRLRMADSSLYPPMTGSPMKLFDFAEGDPDATKRLMDLGVWPWWTWPELRAAFMRPVTVWTHWIDYRLWPSRPALMHAHSLAWFAALVVVVTLLYRRLMTPMPTRPPSSTAALTSPVHRPAAAAANVGAPAPMATMEARAPGADVGARASVAAGLAALLYAIDDARAVPAGWLANRNAVVAAVFGFLALHAHVRWREAGWRAGAFLGPLGLALSLLSKESGIATCAYLFAFAACLDRGTWRQRFVSLVPYGVVIGVWRIVWSHLGYGVAGIGLYVDPLREPLRYASGLFERASVFLLGQFFLPSADVYMLLDSFRLTFPYALVAAAVFLAGVLIALPRLRRDAIARFFALGTMLSLLPICATAPSDRLLSFVGFGAFGLISLFLVRVLPMLSAGVDGHTAIRPRSWGRRLGFSLLAVHAGLAPMLLAVRAWMPVGPPRLLDRLQDDVAMDESVTRQTVVIVTAPIPLLAGFLAERRILDGLPVPLRTRVLAPHYPGPVIVTRTDTRTITVRPGDGYLAQSFCRIARSIQHPLALGERVELTGMTAEVMSLTADGRPAEVAFRFDVPLEDPSLRWQRWGDGRFESFVPPAVGETVSLR